MPATDAAAQVTSIFRSDDDGATWNPLPSAPPVGSILALYLDPLQDDWIVLGTDAGIWVSADGGENWIAPNVDIESSDDPLHAYAIVADPDAPERLWVTTDRGLLLSEDVGQSWHLLTSEAPTMVALAAEPGPDGPILYGGGSDGLFRGLEGGNVWESVSESVEGSVLTLAVGPDGTLLVGTTSGLYERDPESDGYRAIRGLPRGATRAIATLADRRVLAGIGSHVYVRADGWSKLGTLPLSGTGDPPIVTGFISVGEGPILVATDRGLFSSETWRLVPEFADLADVEIGPATRDPRASNRLFLAVSDVAHAVAFARVGIEFGADVESVADDRTALVIGVLFIVGAILAVAYLTKPRPPAAGPS